jgi:hypothetical protein
MSLQITNLTQHQVDLLNAMWDIKEESEYFDWYKSLDHDTQLEVESLQALIILESVDQMLSDLSVARKVLKKFML